MEHPSPKTESEKKSFLGWFSRRSSQAEDAPTGAGKQKPMLLLIPLGLVLFGVGVWQWNRFQDLSQPTPKAQQENPSGQPTPNGENPASTEDLQTFAALPAHDPFMPDPAMVMAATPSSQGQRRNAPIFDVPIRPATRPTGPLPPFTFQQVPDERSGQNPEPGEESSPPQPPTPEWDVVGVVEGPNTVAILKDSQGNRRFVRPGERLEQGFQVQSIRRGEVTLKGQGGQIILRPNNQPNDSSNEKSDTSVNHPALGGR